MIILDTSFFRSVSWGILIACLLCCGATVADGQNLVTNGSFESYNNCPYFIGGVAYSPGYSSFPFVNDWVSPTLTGTPDYYRFCPSFSFASVPSNSRGFQAAHSGISYAGIITYSIYPDINNQEAREFLSTRLSAPLKKDSAYCITFYVSPIFLTSPYAPPAALNQIGANLSDTLPLSAVNNLNVPFHIVSDTSLHMIDTSRWYEVQGVYIAHGGERWLTLGCFGTVVHPAITILGPAVPDIITYDFIDDVSVVPTSVIRTVDTVYPCTTPNPAAVVLRASQPGTTYEWSTGARSDSIVVTQAGKYACKTVYNCTATLDSFYVIGEVHTDVHHVLLCDSAGNSTILTSSLAPARYVWNTGAVTSSIAASLPGVYYCRAVNACAVYTDTFFVSAAQRDTTIEVKVCDSVNISTALSSSVPAARWYAWNTGDSSSQIHIGSIGRYVCKAFDGCRIITDSFRFILDAPEPPLVHDTSVCQSGMSPLLTIAGNLLWYTMATGGTGAAIQPVIKTDSVGQQTLYVAQLVGGCISRRVPVHIRILDKKPEGHPAQTVVRCEVSWQNPIALGTELPQQEIQYTWTSGETSCCITPTVDGQYIRIAANQCGSVADSFTVLSEPCDRCITFPTAFTPNNDGKNDVFKPLIRCPVHYFSLSIYNRWGEVVYASINKDHHWDGTQKGIPAPVGVYMYMCTITNSLTGKRIFTKGELTLVR
jgi:gliding motility-associated-like protein